MLSSHIIFSDDDHQSATTLVKIFEKAGEHVPDKVRQLSTASIEVIF